MNGKIILENISDFLHTGWSFCALPKQVWKGLPDSGYVTDGEQKGLYSKADHGVHVRWDVPAGKRVELQIVEGETRDAKPFQWNQHLEGMRVLEVLPKFWIEGAAPSEERSTLRCLAQTEAVSEWHYRCFWPEFRGVTVDAWFTVYSDSGDVEFAVQAVYGSTANTGQAQTCSMGALYMTTAAHPHVDFARRNGHAAPSYNSATNTWSLTVVGPRQWHRAVRYPLRGVLQADPASTGPRTTGVRLFGLWSGWNGWWGPIGSVPCQTQDLPVIRGRQKQEYLEDTNGSATGNVLAMRPRVQQPNSGTTGEQNDFGVCSDLAVVALMPWEIHDALWQCQGYELRPTANKEWLGEPMSAAKHEQAQTLNQRPDLAYGSSDRLGWPPPNQIAWIPSSATSEWTTSDDQHRSDLFLHATFLLTRDRALEAVINDHIELDRTDVCLQSGLRISPRAVGRLAISRAWQYWLGFERALECLSSGLATAVRYSNVYSQGHEVMIMGGNEPAKYGWALANGQPVIGWQPWQETIAAIGFLSAAKAMQGCGVPWAERAATDYEKIAMLLAHVVTNNAWRISESGIQHAYALRWNYGARFGDGSWPTIRPGDASTDDIYCSTACQSWTAAAAEMLGMSDEMAIRVLQRLWAPRTIAEARWRAL